jgi:potassium efflux system protein
MTKTCSSNLAASILGMTPALLCRLVLAAFLAAALLGPALAQAQNGARSGNGQAASAPLPTAQELAKIQASLDAIEKALEREQLTDSVLADLREQIDPLSARAKDAIAALTPRLASIKTRLEQLGPKPEEKAADGETPGESPAVTAERTDQQTALNEVDESLKRARLITVQADQMSATITARRRALFARSLFERASSIANPELWSDVWRELPRYTQAVQSIFVDWFNGVNARLDGWVRTAFWSGLGLTLFLYVPLALIAWRVLARRQTHAEPSRFRKVLGAWWVILSIIVPPVAVIALLGAAFAALGLNNGRLGPFMASAAEGVIRIVLAFAITRGLFAPTRPNWRLLRRSDTDSQTVVKVAVLVVAIVSVTRQFEALNDIAGASLAFSVVTRGLGALFAAAVLIAGLWRVGGNARQEACFGPQVTAERDWFLLLRIAAWPATLAVVGAVMIGYPTFASFVIDQILWTGGIACLLYLANVLVTEAITSLTQPTNRLGNRIMASLGISRSSFEFFSVLASGLTRLALFALAAALLLAPWGVRSSDFSIDLRTAFFGFTIGDVTVSPASITVAVTIFALALAIAHAILRWVETSLLPVTKLDQGLRNSIRTSLGYVGFIFAAGLALGYLGLNVERLAIVAGALSVGIGFGLQSIVNNFVSGLILLWERAVRVGDWIVVGADQGYVRRINVRSTEIETFDRSQVIIPNSSLITGVVKNLVRNDRTGRLVIPVTVASSADPEKVREVLFTTAKAHELVLKVPSPQVLFTGMSAGSLTFELCVFVADVESMFRVRSDLHFELFFGAPGPDATKIEIAGFDHFAALFGPEGSSPPSPAQPRHPKAKDAEAESASWQGRRNDARSA